MGGERRRWWEFWRKPQPPGPTPIQLAPWQFSPEVSVAPTPPGFGVAGAPIPSRTGRTLRVPLHRVGDSTTIRVDREPPGPLPKAFAPVTFLWGDTLQVLPSEAATRVELPGRVRGTLDEGDVDTGAATIRRRRRPKPP